jgi:hypothetical protein
MKAKNIFSVLFLVAGLSTGLSAQKNKNKDNPDPDKTYNYSVRGNDPENAANLIVTVNPVYANFYTLNINLGYDFNVNYRMNNKIALSGFYSKSYLDRFEKTNGNSSVYHGFADEEQLGVTNYGFGGVFFFKNDLKQVEEEVTLKSTNNGSVTTRYIMKIPAKRLQLFGLRGGYEVFNSPIHSGNGNIDFIAYPAPDSSGQAQSLGSGSFSTMMYSGTLNIGICRTKISNLFIDVNGYGERQATSVNELYIDVMYATKLTFADMLISYQSWNNSGGAFFDQYQPYVVDNTLKSKLGFRIGYSSYANDKFTAFGNFNIEAGMRPGPKAGGNFYLMLKFGLNYAAHVGQ